MAASYGDSWDTTPIGFRGVVNKEPHKSGSIYTAGRISQNLGQALLDDYSSYKRLGWMDMITYPCPNFTGKDLKVDFALLGGLYYFDFTGEDDQKIEIDIQFYDFISKRYDSHWTYWGTYQYSRHSAGAPNPDILGKGSAAAYAYNEYYNCYAGAHKPAYGLVYGSSDKMKDTYDEFADECFGANLNMATWNGSPLNAAYTLVWPMGVRYISNNGYWAPGKLYLDASSTITQDGQEYANWTQDGEDGGNNGVDSYISIHISENFIKAAHGTATGVTAFRLRFRTPSWGWNWYYPQSPVPNNWVMIDNPQLGLFDWGAAGSPEYWNPRFDAKAYYRPANGNDKSRVEVQGKYNSGGSNDWNIY